MITQRTDDVRLAAIYEASAQLSKTLDLSEILDKVMEMTIELTGGERGFISLIGPDTGVAEIVASEKFDKSLVSKRTLDISRRLTDQVQITRIPVLTNNGSEDATTGTGLTGFKLRSMMAVPMQARSRVIGTAYVDNRYTNGIFEPNDLDTFVILANQAALAIDNARLFQRTDDALSRRVDELSVFQQIDHQLNQSLDLDIVLDLVVDWAVQLTRAIGGSLGLVKHHSDQIDDLNVLVRKGEHVNSNLATKLPIAEQVLDEGKTVIAMLESEGDDEEYRRLMVPIKKDGAVTGLIMLDSTVEQRFTQDDREVVERLADRAAVAIGNARLYDEVRAAKEAQSNFIRVVAHEIRNPMASINGHIGLMATESLGPITDLQKESLDVIKGDIKQMNLLLEDLSDLNRIEMGQLQLKPTDFDLNMIISEVMRSHRERITSKGQAITKLAPESPVIVHADRARTNQILSNLITNAHKYSPEGGRITIRLDHGSSRAHVSIIDNGIGISEAEQERIFTQFFRADNDFVQDQSGSGLGLSIVRVLVEAQGGSIKCQSVLGEGSIFTFTLPLTETVGV